MFGHRFWGFVVAVALVVAVLPARVVVQTPSPTPALDPANPVFDDTVLHEVRLAINPRDWQTLLTHYLEDTYYTADFRWRDQVVRNIGIRSRGKGSRSGVKPGIRVDFNRNVTGQEFLGLKSLVLRNQTQDASNMHETLSMLFFRRMGLPAEREAFTKLYINNEYAGLYSIVEAVDKDFLKKRFDEDGGWLYKYEYEPGDKNYYLDYRGSNGDLYVPSPFKPETNDTDPQQNVIAELIRMINQDSDNTFQQRIASYLDVEKFIKYIALEIFLGDDDDFNGNWGANNFFWYRFHHNTVFTFILWDKSNAFNDGFTYPIFHNIYDQPPERVNHLTARVLKFDEWKSKFLDTLLVYANALSDSTSVPTPLPPGTLRPAPDPTPTPTPTPNPADPRGWMERELEREYALIKDAVYADPSREKFTNADFEREVENLRNFARQRGDFVKNEVARTRGQ